MTHVGDGCVKYSLRTSNINSVLVHRLLYSNESASDRSGNGGKTSGRFNYMLVPEQVLKHYI